MAMSTKSLKLTRACIKELNENIDEILNILDLAGCNINGLTLVDTEYYRILERQRKLSNDYATKHREEIRRKNRERYAENKERELLKRKRYAEKHREELNRKRREYHAKHREEENRKNRERSKAKKEQQAVTTNNGI